MNRRHDLAVLFLRKAAEDAAIVFLDAAVPESIFGFHAQQTAEKLLKAVLTEQGVEFRRKHRIRELMTLTSEAGLTLPESSAQLDILSPFAVEFRYEDIPTGEEPPLDRTEIRRMLTDLRTWAEGQVPAG